jgi:crotonobetainyl-CoA:carnitine CoA-transferase CaiB-like acyl-CoA transferase
MSVTGYKGGKPVKAGVPVADIGCAMFAVYGLLSAYIGAQKSGEGQHIDASLFDSIMAFSIWDMSDYWGTGVPPTPLGTSNKMSAPYQAVKARDGYFVMGATNQKLWTKLCGVLERPDLIDHTDYATVSLRLKNREAMIEVLEQEFAKRDSSEWVDVLLAAGIPAGPILSYPEAFESDHARHRNMCKSTIRTRARSRTSAFPSSCSARRQPCAAIRRCWVNITTRSSRRSTELRHERTG